MAAVGALAIPYLAPRFAYSPAVAAACVRALLQIGSETAFNMLLAYTTDDTSAVIETLVQGLREFTDKPAYAQRFLSHVKSISHFPPLFARLHRLPDRACQEAFLSNLPSRDDMKPTVLVSNLVSRSPVPSSIEKIAHSQFAGRMVQGG